MRKESVLPIRLDSDINRRIEEAAKKLGFTKSALIRMLIQSFLEQLEANGGKITLPPQWESLMADSLGRHSRRVAESSSPIYGVRKGRGRDKSNP